MSEFVNKNNTSYRIKKDYAEVIDKISREAVCPFCPESLEKFHKNPIFLSKKYWLATKNMYPYKGSAHHILFIFKKHVESIDEVSQAGWTELQQLVMQTVKKFNIKGATLMCRFGATAYNGATVTHLHAQLVSGTGDPSARPVMTRVG